MSERKNISNIVLELRDTRKTELIERLEVKYQILISATSLEEQNIFYKIKEREFETLVIWLVGKLQNTLRKGDFSLCIKLFLLELVLSEGKHVFNFSKVQLILEFKIFLKRNRII